MEYFQKKGYQIGEEEEKLCYEVMEFYLKNTKEIRPLKNYLQRLNKLVLNKMINIIDNHIEKERNEQKINIDKKDMGKVYEDLLKERSGKIIKKKDEKEIQKKIKEDVKEDNSKISKQYEIQSALRQTQSKIETQSMT